MSDIRKPANQQEHHNPETEEDTASGGPADPPTEDASADHKE
jgi:hypothetical protein